MYDRLLALWIQGRLTETQLAAAVAKQWITAEQQQTILDTPR
jgi:hypothetical protein